MVAVLLRWLLDPLLAEHLPLVTLFAAVAIVAWLGGYRPALVVVALGYLACNHLFIEPRGGLSVSNVQNLTGLVAFLVSCSIIIAFAEAMRVAQRRAEMRGELLRVTISSVGDAVITTDARGRISTLNPVAEVLTGWTQENAQGMPLETVFKIINEETRQSVENPVVEVLKKGNVVGLANHTILIAKDGSERSIDDSAAPIRSKEGEIFGCVLIFRDVTERRKAERVVADARAYAENIVDTVREPLIVLNGDLRVQTASRSFYQAFHVTPEGTRGRLIYDLGNNQWDIPALRQLLTEVVPKDKQFNDYEVEHDFPTIGKRHMLLNARRVYREGNHTELILLAFEDITARRHLERQNAEQSTSARLLASIVESSEDAIISKSLDSIIQSWNAAAERVFGFTEAEALGRHISLIIPADRIHEEEEIIARIRAGKRIEHFDTVRQRRDGTLIPVSLTISPVRNEAGQIIGASKIARDITERKQTERKLQMSEARLGVELMAMTRLHELVTRLLACTDLRTALEEVLDAAISLLDAKMGNVQLVNLKNNSLEIVAHRGYTEEFLNHFRVVGIEDGCSCGRALRNRERVVIDDVDADSGYEQHRAIAASAGIRAVQSTPLISHSGELLGVLSTHFHQPHRPSEAALRVLDLYAQQAADFIERIRSAEALRQITAELSEADRRKNEFLAMLAHELRNPLAPIRNAVRIMRQTENDNPAVAKASEMMDRQVGQMVRLVDDLLDVSRISRGKIELKKQRVELASAVHHAVEAARSNFETKSQNLTVMLPREPIYLDADQTRLAQVVGNLLTNACKFTDTGGRIWLTVEREDQQAVIRVRDSGIGIAAEQLPRIFDLFVQIDTTLERTTSGLGIGLTLVKRLVEMHEGNVEVHSHGVGRGSEFVVRLPIPDEAFLPPQPGVSQPTSTKSHRIVVVDDNRDSADSLAMLLRLSGNETHTAYDGLEALEATNRIRPDVVLMDIGLPKLNGYEACRHIREQPWGKEIVLVALTGWGQEDDRQRTKEAGFDYHLVKPVEYAELMEFLAEKSMTN
jgi:PAS domain S-box-containing protein